MIRNSLAVIFLLATLTAVAQTDPVLMRINGKDVLRSEFEYAYNKQSKLTGTGQKTLKEFVDLFADSKLKVAAAEAAGIDTTRVFRDKLDNYRRQLAKSYLTDEETTEQVARRFYDKMKADRHAGQVRVSQIFKYLPQNISGYTLSVTEARMDSIYEALAKKGAKADFDAYVKKFSDEKNSFWVSWLQMPAEFEEVAFGLNVGDISRPFFTPQGIHIVKVLEKKEAPSFDRARDEIVHNLTRRHGMDKGTDALVEKLKKEYHYTLDKVAVQELMDMGKTNRTLFVLAGKPYSGKDFARFATAHPGGVQYQLKGFVMKSVLDYENSRLEQKYPEFHRAMQEYREGMLLKEISNRRLGGLADENGLKAYFESHRSDYHWKEPRYKGIVLHCVTKRVSKQVRKFLRQLPDEEWLDAIRLTFNAEDTPKVQAEQGLFARGDNAFVDDLVFKGEEPAPVLSFPFTVVLGKKLKGPESYREVQEQVATDYQNYLERRWTENLRTAGKVEINQEVLKTVNNH